MTMTTMTKTTSDADAVGAASLSLPLSLPLPLPLTAESSWSVVQFLRNQRLQLRPYTDQELHHWIQAYSSSRLNVSAVVDATTPLVASKSADSQEGVVTVTDYQMAAWLMAVCCRGLTASETAALTQAMVQSGQLLQWPPLRLSQSSSMLSIQTVATTQSSDQNPNKMSYNSWTIGNEYRSVPLVDKHSTGGVGDKVSIVLAPLVATLGAAVPMMAGRGLGHTGGTIDKLESIPGFSGSLSVSEFQHIVCTVGCCISTTGPTLCPADRFMYALRDVTDTVSSLPLQTASIMSKKIAEHPDSIVLDTKYGLGSFQSTQQEAADLAQSMVATGEAAGLSPTTAFLTRMDEPLGYTVGNALEIVECIDILQGNVHRPHNQDLITLIVVQAAQMLFQSGLYRCDFNKHAITLDATETSPNNDNHDDQHDDAVLQSLICKAYHMLQSGQAWPTFQRMVLAQGGDLEAFQIKQRQAYGVLDLFATVEKTVIGDNVNPLPLCQHHVLRAIQSGYLSQIHAQIVGQVAVRLGAGRAVASDRIDIWAGMIWHKKVGDAVQSGDAIVTLYCHHGGNNGKHHGDNTATGQDEDRESILLKNSVERLHREAIQYSLEPVQLVPIVTHQVTHQRGCQPWSIPVFLHTTSTAAIVTTTSGKTRNK